MFIGGFPIFKPKEGTNDIRILPVAHKDLERWVTKLKVGKHWAFPIFRHTNIGPDRASYLCRNRMLRQTCSLCEERRLVGNDQDALKALNTSPGSCVWILDRNNEAAGAQLWVMPQTKVEREVLTRSKPRGSTKVLQITHPDNGFDVTFNVEKKGDFPQYSGVDIAREESPISDDPAVQKKILDFITEHPLDSMLRWFEDDYIFRVYAGQQEQEDEDLGGDEAQADTAAGESTEEADGESEAETNGGDPGEFTYEDIRAMDEDQLRELCESQEPPVDFDMKDFDNDLATAQESLVAFFFGDDVPEREEAEEEAEEEAQEEEAPPPARQTIPVRRPAVAQKKDAPAARTPAKATGTKTPTNSGGGSADAAARLRNMRNRQASAH